MPLGEGGDGSALADWRGTVAGVGDLVQARSLAWHLRGFEGNTAAPITRQTYRVIVTRADGGLTVAPILANDAESDVERKAWGEQLGTPMQLPGTYVREHLSLGYASTKDAAQGRTVDTSHAVTGPGTDAAGLYVPATRGWERNTIYAVTRHLAPDAETGETFDAAARTPEAVLADVLASIREDRSALAEQAHAEDEAQSVMTQVDRMADLIRDVSAGRVADTLDRLVAAGQLTPHQRGQLAADDAFGFPRTAAAHRRTRRPRPGPGPDRRHRGPQPPRRRLPGPGAAPPHHALARRAAHAPPRRRRRGPSSRTTSVTPSQSTTSAPRGCTSSPRPRTSAAANSAPSPPRPRQHGRSTRWVPSPTAATPRRWSRRRTGNTAPAGPRPTAVGHTDEHDPLGNAPGKGRVEHAVMFCAAHEALALVDAGAEEANLSDGALRSRVRAYKRELAWAPRWVEDDLAAAH